MRERERERRKEREIERWVEREREGGSECVCVLKGYCPESRSHTASEEVTAQLT